MYNKLSKKLSKNTVNKDKNCLLDGKIDPVSSDEVSFKIAASLGVSEGLIKANPILEPKVAETRPLPDAMHEESLKYRPLHANGS